MKDPYEEYLEAGVTPGHLEKKTNKEIIERVREDLVGVFRGVVTHTLSDGYNDLNAIIGKVLSHPNIAIVEPDAELPNYWFDQYPDKTVRQHYIPDGLQDYLVEAGWVRRVKDE